MINGWQINMKFRRLTREPNVVILAEHETNNLCALICIDISLLLYFFPLFRTRLAFSSINRRAGPTGGMT